MAEEEARVEAAKEAQRLSIAAKRKEQAALDADAVTVARAREGARFCGQEAKSEGRTERFYKRERAGARGGCERAERPAVERAASAYADDRRRERRLRAVRAAQKPAARQRG